ncbi:MAG: hypothetical protein K0S25_804 [Bacillus sp. (in: firmicutes)]|nr:hypothetical protein [Bacillus sp. (in: firmicutes)]
MLYKDIQDLAIFIEILFLNSSLFCHKKFTFTFLH